jgi:hypothetical protein
VAIPEVTPQGVTFARFRLSRDGGLGPSGFAVNGEVEDYRVDIVSAQPWTNPDDAYDVNRDGDIVPLDALLIINELNNHVFSDTQTGLLPNPPVAPNLPDEVGYVDADGDGYVAPRDALLIINRLNSLAAVPNRQPAAAIAAGDSVMEQIAAALATSEQGDQLETTVWDQVVQVRSTTRARLLDAAPGTVSSVFADPRLHDADFELAVDVLAEDVVKSLHDEDLWIV